MKKILFLLCLALMAVVSGCSDEEAPVVPNTGTVNGVNTSGPHVAYIVPANGAVNFINGAPITVVFDRAMNPLTLDSSNIAIVDQFSGNPWPFVPEDPTSTTGVVFTFTSNDAKDAVTISSDGFLISGCFLIKVSTNVMAANGEHMAAPYQSCFCTVGEADSTCGQ